jgi:hypothetical protein
MKPALAKGAPLSICMKGNKAWSMAGSVVEIVAIRPYRLDVAAIRRDRQVPADYVQSR